MRCFSFLLPSDATVEAPLNTQQKTNNTITVSINNTRLTNVEKLKLNGVIQGYFVSCRRGQSFFRSHNLTIANMARAPANWPQAQHTFLSLSPFTEYNISVQILTADNKTTPNVYRGIQSMKLVKTSEGGRHQDGTALSQSLECL